MSETMNDRFHRWFRGNAQAADFVCVLWDAMHQWDDIEDAGRCENHNATIAWLAFGKEYHPFFRANADILRPVMLSAYLQWRAANVLDHGSQSDVCKSYMLRAGFYGVIHVATWICGGDDWAAECGPEIYRSYGETPEEIWKEFNHA